MGLIKTFFSYHDRTSAQQHEIANTFGPQGFRFVSISVYGPAEAPLYAGVLLLRDAVVPQQARWDIPSSEFTAVFDEMHAKGLVPALISATGVRGSATFAVVFEPAPGLTPRTIFDFDTAGFNGENQDAGKAGGYLRSAALYGSPDDRGYAAVWWPNQSKVAWHVFNDINLVDDGQIVQAMVSQWGRLYFVTRSADGTYLSAYRDDAVGVWVAFDELDSAGYQAKSDELTGQGFIPMCIQAGGNSASAARFTGIFAKSEDVLPRKFKVVGPSVPELKPLDDLMKLGMEKTGTRAAQVAVGHQGKVVQSRAYTFADDSYPATTTGNIFRTASCSKALTAIVALQLIEKGSLSLDTLVQDKLKLTPPPKMSFSGPTDANWPSKIRVRHLLNHLSGLHHGDPLTSDVATAFEHPDNYTLTKREYISFALCKMLFPPGGPVPAGVDNYSNTGYLLLGMVVASVTGLPYEDAVKTMLLAPLGITTARRSKSLVEERAPNEVFYHSVAFTALRSQVTADEPFVASQYGSGGDMLLGDASGSWAISAEDFVRVLSRLDRDPPNGIFSKKSTLDTLWATGPWQGVIPSDNARDLDGAPVKTRVKGGGYGGTSADVMHRADRLTLAFITNFDVWPSDSEMSLGKVNGTWGAFQLNERLNLATASPRYPFLFEKEWKVNANGSSADLVIDTIDNGGRFRGRFLAGERADKVDGVWHRQSRSVVFSRVRDTPATTQVFTGYLSPKLDRMTGSFEAFSGTGGSPNASVFGWAAWLSSVTSL